VMSVDPPKDRISTTPTPAPIQITPSAPVAHIAPPAIVNGQVQFTDANQLYTFCKTMAATQVIPKAYQGKPNDAFACAVKGMEYGFSPMQSFASIGVINGVAGLYGDMVPGLCYATGMVEGHEESWEGEGQDRTAICRVKRKGFDWYERRFSMKDAQRAGLLGKETYKQNPDVMIMWRARGHAWRGRFPDVLKGLPLVEEIQDYAPTKPTATVEITRPNLQELG
jgi:hypothetical protein